MATAPFRTFNAVLRAKAILINGVKTATASFSATRKANAGRTNVLNAAAGMTVTLPASSGSGDRYRFLIGTTITSNTTVIKVANATDVMVGGIIINDIGDSTAATADFHPTASTSDTITLTAAIGAGKKGDWIELEDFATGFWAVKGALQGETDPANPFSASVS
jgi:hypothetical protein